MSFQLLEILLSNTSAIFKAKRKQLTLKYLEYCVELDQLEKECPHQDLTYKYGGSSGNWDKSDDKYWIDWKCHDCGKSWTTSQDNTWHLTRKVYPQAKQVK
jgi:transposase-like protein